MRIRGINSFNNKVAGGQKLLVRLLDDVFLRDKFLKILGFSRVNVKESRDNRMILALRLNALGDT